MLEQTSLSQPAYFTRTYDEAMSLMLEARHYLRYGEQRDRGTLQPMDRLAVSCETMRLTSRLTQVMAWLLVRKAVHAGELTELEAATEAYRLSGHSVCSDAGAPIRLPRPLRSLLDRSRHLYERVSRLDELVYARMQDGDVELPEVPGRGDSVVVLFAPSRRRLN